MIGDLYMYKFVKQLIDKKTACACLAFSLTFEFINNYILRTSANSCESNLMWVVFYYYLNIRPRVHDGALVKLTVAVTLSFLIRSSSLLSYLPLVLMTVVA